jgi:hypothetical protein
MSHKSTAVVTSHHHTAKRGADIPQLDNEVNQVVYCSEESTLNYGHKQLAVKQLPHPTESTTPPMTAAAEEMPLGPQ